MLSHPGREDRIHILTLDHALAADLRERICCDPAMPDCKVICPQDRGTAEIIAEIEAMAPHTVSSRLLIMDVRRYTLPMLRHAYNKIIGYNRRDLNRLCYTILIGDGPWNLFHAGNSPEVFAPLLASHRRDYDAGVFFYDPFLHHTADEHRGSGIDRGEKLLQRMPQRLAKEYWKDDADMKAVRRYFRAVPLSGSIRENVRARREELLAKFFEDRTAEEFPHHRNLREAWLSKEGYSFAGEILKLHMYPFFLEAWVSELMEKARLAAFQGVAR